MQISPFINFFKHTNTIWNATTTAYDKKNKYWCLIVDRPKMQKKNKSTQNNNDHWDANESEKNVRQLWKKRDKMNLEPFGVLLLFLYFLCMYALFLLL